MRKGFVVLLAAVLAAAFALPAAAGVDVNGFVGVKPIVSNAWNYGLGYYTPVAGKTNTGSTVENTNTYIEERARLKFTVGDENVKAVFQFEYDMAFGDSAYSTGRNIGAGLEGDTINQETKNIYLWFKVPNTTLDVTAGLLNATDAYAGVFLGYADVAGIVANLKLDQVGLRFGYMKFWENLVRKEDDTNFYIVEAKFSPSKTAKVGANLYFLQDRGGLTHGSNSTSTASSNFPGLVGGSQVFGERAGVIQWSPAEIVGVGGDQKVHVWMPGVDFSVAAGPATISGFGFYQFGKVKSNAGAAEVDIKGYAVDVRADVAAGPGKLFVEALYTTGDDNKTDKDYKGILTGGNYNLAGAFYARTDTFLLLPNLADYNTSQHLAYDVGNGGAGVTHIATGFTVPVVADKLKVKGGLAYLAASKKRARDVASINFVNEKGMGTEANAVLTYTIQKGLTFDLVGAYCWLGKAYKPVTGLTDPDDLYLLNGRLVYAF
jgi:hypothetical protein